MMYPSRPELSTPDWDTACRVSMLTYAITSDHLSITVSDKRNGTRAGGMHAAQGVSGRQAQS